MPSSSIHSRRRRRRRFSTGVGSSWSLLPDVVLVDILGRLRSLPDFFAARAVCRDWKRVASDPSLSPKVLLIVNEDRVGNLYDIVSHRFYDLPFIHSSRRIIGYPRAHLITLPRVYYNGSVHLWNLFTRAKTVLPQLPCSWPGRIILSARPDTPHCQIIIFTCESSTLEYLNVGDGSWSFADDDQMISVRDMMFFQGEWLALTEDMELLGVKLTGESLTVRELGGEEVVSGRKFSNWWLGESDGVLFAVRRDSKSDFDVFWWDSEKKGWEETRDVGDKALFVSQLGNLVFIPATRLGLRKNCVYWAKDKSGLWEEFLLDDRSRITLPGFVPLLPAHFWVVANNR